MAPAVDQLEAVTFDFWDTLVVARFEGAREARRVALFEVFESHGYDDITTEQLDIAFDEAVRAQGEHWMDNRLFTAADGAEVVLASLGRSFALPARTDLVEAFVDAGSRAESELTPNVAATLAILDDADLRLGIICDVGMSPSPVLRGYLERHGVLRHFDHWSFSDEVGVYKPDAVIFEHALAGLGGVDPTRTVHVGDLRRTDVAGARAMGMTSVRYRGANDDGVIDPDLPEAHHVLDDHAHLPELLGLL